MRYKGIAGALVLLTLLLPMSAVAETIFWLDTPHDGATVFGLVEVNGFVVDDGEQCGPQWTWNTCEWAEALVSNIELYVDDEFVATADINQPRYDVLQAYPWYAGTPYSRPGFATSIDSAAYADGVHTLFIRITFSDSTVGDYGHRSFTVDNNINQAPFGALELPGTNQPMNGVFPITGWALDDSEVVFVEILVDGLAMGNAVTGRHRPDILHRFPSNLDAEYSGFVRMLNTTVLPNGIHVIAVRVMDDEGASRVIGRRFVQTFNTGSNLPPFGEINWPIADATMQTTGCNPTGTGGDPPWSGGGEPFDVPEVVGMVLGWTLDVGSRTDFGGVSYVQLLLDGNIIADTNTGSFYWDPAEMDFNYYGHPRMDIHELYVDVPNSKHAGFAFLMDIADLMFNHGYGQGLHYIKIRAGDIENNVTDIAQLPVIFDCNDDPDLPSFGDIYTPAHMELEAGIVEVTGFAIDSDRIDAVEIWVDGTYVGDADFGLLSPEVEDLFPWLPSAQTEDAGFRYEMDTVALGLADGEHSIVVWTEDKDNSRTIVGERRWVLDNLNPP
ncbi:MAG: hypothetical protein KAJ97_03185 [Acidobacteria bacterium]|nr:hypothetical protein [Acidobacteriota bacterium]